MTCEECGGPLPSPRRPSRRFCSKTCSRRAYRRANREHLMTEMARWSAANRPAQYEAARSATRVRLAAKVCEFCGEVIVGARRETRRFCSRSCVNQSAMKNRPMARRNAEHRYRARKRAGDAAAVTARDWRRLMARYGGCAYCGRSDLPITMDHVIPLSRGGRHAIGNLLPACFPCNASKRDDLLVYWRHGRKQARLRVVI